LQKEQSLKEIEEDIQKLKKKKWSWNINKNTLINKNAVLIIIYNQFK
jgi:hypothetical protein